MAVTDLRLTEAYYYCTKCKTSFPLAINYLQAAKENRLLCITCGTQTNIDPKRIEYLKKQRCYVPDSRNRVKGRFRLDVLDTEEIEKISVVMKCNQHNIESEYKLINIHKDLIVFAKRFGWYEVKRKDYGRYGAQSAENADKSSD